MFGGQGKGLLADSHESLRKMVLGLYALVTPPFVLVLGLTAEPTWRWPAVGLVSALCVLAFLTVWLRKAPTRDYWTLSIVVPTISCGVAFLAAQPMSLVFLIVMGAPMTWAAVLMGKREVLAGLFVGAFFCFLAAFQAAGLGAALANLVLFGVIQGLVGAVVYGKMRFQRAHTAMLERQMHDVELILRTDGTIVHANDRAVATYGYPRSELLSMNIRRLRRPEDLELVGKQINTSLSAEGMRFETDHMRADGTVFPVEVSSRHYEVDGHTFMHSVIRDITVQRLMEAHSAMLLQEAEEDAQRRANMMAVVAHDLRNPLSAIEMTAGGIAKAPAPPKNLGERVELIQSASERMRRMIDDLLDIGAIQAGHLRIVRQHEAAVGIIEEAVRTSAGVAEARGIILTSGGGDAGTLDCDRGRILQVVGNLLSNALQMTPAGGAVTATVVDDPAGVRFTVQDGGPGIPPEDVKLIFDAYHRAGTAKYRGMGLGLAISKGIVEAHGGRITAGNAPEGGARFSFTLPRA